jgi:hypothetical protein
MTSTANPPARRTFLQRLLLFLGGGVGLAASTRVGARGEVESAGVRGTAPPRERTLTVHGRWMSSATAWGGGQAPRDHGVRHGVIVDEAGGEACGELTANTFSESGPFGPPSSLTSALELQTLRLRDGTLFGLGAPKSGECEERAFAVLGGTGRFAGARGSYLERPTACGDQGAAEFTIRLF